MPTCQSWQAPYSYQGFQGSTALEVCTQYTSGQPGTVTINGLYCTLTQEYEGQQYVYTYPIDHVCDVSEPPENPVSSPTVACTGVCQLQIELKPAPPDAERIQDIVSISGLFLGAAVIIVCMRGLLKLFDSTPHSDS